MTRGPQRTCNHNSETMRNVTASMLAGAVVACIYYSYDHVQAEETVAPTRISSREEAALLKAPVIAQPGEAASKSVPNPLEREESPEAEPVDPNVENLQFTINTLQDGIDRLENVDQYSFTFIRQERIDGELKDEQEIDVKLRHAPFSVYMKWVTGDPGRELLYTENQNDGQMLVKLGGLKGRFIPTLKLDPEGARAKAETRHSITQAGLVNLARKIVRHRRHDLEKADHLQCVVEDDHTFNDRSCYRVYLEYDSPKYSPEYRKTIALIDKELKLPVYSRNYTWPTETMADVEKESLISCYRFRNIQIKTELAAATWNSENPDYRFR